MSKKTELNELVREYQTSKNQAVFLKIYSMTMDIAKFHKAKIQQHHWVGGNAETYFTAAYDQAITKAIKSYNCNIGNFENFFVTILKNEIHDELKLDYKEYYQDNPDYDPSEESENNGHKKNDRYNSDDDLSEKTDEYSGNNKRIMVKRLDSSHKNDDNSQETDAQKLTKNEDSEEFEKIIGLLEVMLGAVKIREKQMKNRPKNHWDICFFAEDVASTIRTDDNAYLYVSGNSRRFLSAISLDFINSYTTSKCCSISDIKNAVLKTVDEYRHNGSDAPCGYDLIYEVYEQYFGTSKSSVSQNRDSYYLRIREALT